MAHPVLKECPLSGQIVERDFYLDTYSSTVVLYNILNYRRTNRLLEEILP